MEKEKRPAMVFLVLGMAFNTIGITNQKESIKITFISLGLVFLIIAIVQFGKLMRKKDN